MVGVYNTDKTFVSAIYPKNYASDFGVTDGVTQWTAFMVGGNQSTSVPSEALLRIGGTPIDGETIVVTVNEEIVESSGGGYDSVDVSADFTDAKGELVGYFAGHTHADYIYGYSDYGINIVTHRCDSAQENNSDLLAEKVKGTTTEQSFDVVTVNKKDRKIYLTKIGAGADRELSF